MTDAHQTSKNQLAQKLRALAAQPVFNSSAFAILPELRQALNGAATEIERLEHREEDRNGDWMDKWGACKVCGGEIPDGHTTNCDVWKLEMRARYVDQARAALERWSHDGRLQTFEDRERFRKEVAGLFAPVAQNASEALPGDGTRRAAFNEWWQMMWKDNDPRSSPGFDEQMRSWSLDAWQAGAAHERDRISTMRVTETGPALPATKYTGTREQEGCTACGHSVWSHACPPTNNGPLGERRAVETTLTLPATKYTGTRDQDGCTLCGHSVWSHACPPTNNGPLGERRHQETEGDQHGG